MRYPPAMKRSGRALVLASLLAACAPATAPTSETGRTDAPPTTSGPEASATTAASAPPLPSSTSAPDARVTFAWRGPEPSGAKSYDGPIAISTRVGTCRFVFDSKTVRQSIECAQGEGKSATRLWGWDERASSSPYAALASDEDTLFVARYSPIASGCEVRAFELESGRERYRVPVRGLGPVDHSQYANEVQLALTKDKLEILGWESAGRYVEQLEPFSGRFVSTVRIGENGKMSRIVASREPPRPEPPHPGLAGAVRWGYRGSTQSDDVDRDAEVSIGKVRCRFTVDKKKDTSHLGCEDASKHQLFGIDRAKQSVHTVALATDGERLFVADYIAIATGVIVSAIDPSSGARLWSTNLFGAGPVSHSKYRNSVQMAMVDRRLVVFGWESAGKYVEILDPASGADLGNRAE